MKTEIFRISSEQQFRDCCLKIFHFQYDHCVVYRRFVDGLEVNPSKVHDIEQIPFLPISLFKTQKVVSDIEVPDKGIVFSSSATTGMVPSKHFVLDLSLYEESFIEGFRCFYGEPREYAFLALLPSYLEREGSSLVYMVKTLMDSSNHPENGFFLYNHQELFSALQRLRDSGQKTVLFGVTFALLDFAAKYTLEDHPDWNLSVIETGGMKGRGEEISRAELHRILSDCFKVGEIHSEYGMCELLSQGYSLQGGVFRCPPWMRVMARDLSNPFEYVEKGKKGAVNVIDLANIYSCSFIATEDVGIVFGDKSYRIEGRLDKAERRGCNMLIE